MSKKFMFPKTTAVVGIKLERLSVDFASELSWLARRLHLSLELVHVVKPVGTQVRSTQLGQGIYLGDVAAAIDASYTGEAFAALSKYAEAFEIPTGQKVMTGSVAACLIAESKVRGASIVIVGAGTTSYPYIHKSFSTALSLMADAECPVLVVPETRGVSLKKDAPRIMIADDLRNECEGAVIMGMDIARAFGGCSIMHIHVAANGVGDGDRNSDGARDEFASMERRVTERLAARAPERRSLLDAQGVIYTTGVRFGDAVDGLQHAATEFDPDIIVFGRHRSFHKKPLGVGRVSFNQMLMQRRAVLIVPPT